MRSLTRLSTAGVLGAAALALLTGCLGSSDSGSGDQDANRNSDAKKVELTIGSNSVKGGKSSAGATFIEDVLIPKFVAEQKGKGVDVTVKFQGDDTVGDEARVNDWDGWKQIPESVQQLGSFEGKRYGVPGGTDGRVLFFNKKLFQQAGLPADWQPKSWDDIITAGQALKKVPGVTPIQINAGTAMGEATTMQGVLPLLVGTGATVNTDGKWLGDTPQLRQVLDFYHQIYSTGLGDPVLQREAKGRDKSFAEFAANKVGILLESDYFWRSVVEPKAGVAKMADRDSAVGYALIPAAKPGAGVKGQDFVSMSGGGATVINPNTKFPQQAWELLQFMNSADMVKASLDGAAKITQRSDVNSEVLASDPMLSFIADKVLPLTQYRPGLAEYPKISAALQQATADVVGGKSTEAAAQAYEKAVEAAAGGKDKVTNN
jgi:multiple sugar transport system substrate-binding protein